MANVLVLDSHHSVRELLAEELISRGYRVLSSKNANTIGDLIQNFQPDLVLLDLFMNGDNRWDVLENIKGWYPHLPVLIVTAYEGYRSDPRLGQADGFVVKNSNLEETIGKITEILQRRAAQFFRAEKTGLVMQPALSGA